MQDPNYTAVTEFLLVGFHLVHTIKILVFILFLLIYIVIITGNTLVIVLVSTCHHLQSPMYFFLSHLSSSEMVFTTSIVPKMLQVIASEGATISIPGCILQHYFLTASGITECFLLTVMSYDRYLAICNPLHYPTIMDLKLRLHLVIWSWVLGGTMAILVTATLIRKLQFCDRKIIDHFFCDLAPILELSCSDASTVQMIVSVLSMPIILIPFMFIIATYVSIILTIQRIKSNTGRQKAFSTCSSHLAVAGTYYGTLMTLYMTPSKGYLLKANKVLSLLYTVVTPMLNPIIYSLKNQEIKTALWTFIYSKFGKEQHFH
ncbi:olfactory receptor-like protein OLF1 [Ascaphus truei]|uniref:olfactory receptor-like protein OLF1 n=1 Tax=Ascaphus truei TaxID=8439 RepID=UPI003F5A1D5C